MKSDIESKMTENDTDEHLSSRQSYRARQYHRLAHSFETTAEATERASKSKREVYVPTTDNSTGYLDQLLTDIRSWPNGTKNWVLQESDEKQKFAKNQRQ